MLNPVATLNGRSRPAVLRRSRGLTMIEMAIVVAIIGILAAAGMPMMSEFMRDNQVRAMAERFSDGLARARIEAVQRNATLDFVVDGKGWRIDLTDPASGTTTKLREVPGTSADAQLAVTASHAQLSFNGRGRAGTSGFTIDFGHAAGTCAETGGEIRCLRITVSPLGAVRTCDPAVANTDPRACS